MTSYAISEDDFVQVLEDMRAHSHKCLAQGVMRNYIPSKHVEKAYNEYRFIPPSNLDALDDFEKNLKKDAKPGTETFSNDSKTDITGITNTYKSDIDANKSTAENDFVSAMNQSREKAKNNAGAVIDKAYNEAIAYGKDKPKEVQKRVLSFTETITGGITAVAAKIAEFVMSAVKKVVEWIKTAIKAIEETFSKIGTFIGNLFG